MSPTLLSGPEQAPQSGNVKQLVIFLHGVGSDGDDLIGLTSMMDLPDTLYFSPHAPFPYDMAPFGRQWFSLTDRNVNNMLKGIDMATPILNATIDALMAKHSLTSSQIALVGFSQGSMMSLYTAPRRAEPLAGVVGISGALLAGEKLSAEIKSRPSVCLIHGEEDQVVPFGAMQQAKDVLAQNNVPVEAHARARLGHGIDEPAIEIVTGFLKTRF